MNRSIIILLLLFIGASHVNYSQKVTDTPQKSIEELTIPNEIIVRLHPGTHPNSILKQISGDYNLEINRILSEPTNIWLLNFDETTISLEVLIRTIDALPEVTAAQSNTYVQLRATTPNDPLFGNQWHHNKIDSPDTWDITTGGGTATNDDIVVCIIESANVMGHPDLQANHWTNTAEVVDGTDTDGNGYIDDVNGWNVSTGNHNIGSGPHGTSVAGMVGAVGNNGIGVTGASWDVKMMIVSGHSQPFTQANIVEAYTYPLQARLLWNETKGEKGAFVVATNASWGFDNANPNNYPIWCGFYNDLGQAGILNCGATTNANVNVDNTGDVPTGCASDYMIGVTATNSNDIVGTGYGVNTIDVAAPGLGIYTTSQSGYETTSGTSFASPLTAGVIGLMYSIPCEGFIYSVKNNPQAVADIVRDALYDGVDQTAHLNTRVSTGGRINSKTSIDLLMALMCVDNDLGVIEINQPESGLLTANETIEVLIKNFGTNTESNFLISYQVDNGTIVTETFTGSVAPGMTATHTFAATANLSVQGQEYTIKSYTDLFNDGNGLNDGTNKTVKTIDANDIGVTAILNPVSGFGLSATEDITIEITNFGSNAQTNFDVLYTLDSNPSVIETVTQTLQMGQTISYTFNQTADFSALDNYILSASTLLQGDVSPANDELSISISNSPCQPTSDCSDNDGLTKFVLNSINLQSIPCNNVGYYNYSALSATLDVQVGSFAATLQSGYQNNEFSAWIDFNDDGEFEPSELIFQNITLSAANTDVNVPFNISSSAPNGNHLMRVRGKWAEGSGNLNNPCDNLEYGKTIDFTVTIINSTLSANDFVISSLQFVMVSNNNKQFDAVLTTHNNITDPISIKIYTMLGQEVFSNIIESNGNTTITYPVNMASYASGVYLVKVGSSGYEQVQRIVVR